MKGRADSGLGFGPDAAAMATYDALYRGQPNARALELVGGVQALKRSEQLGRVHRVEARAIVANEVDGGSSLRLRTDLDSRLRMLARELPSVAQQASDAAASARSLA
jgi:hypothetical protein